MITKEERIRNRMSIAKEYRTEQGVTKIKKALRHIGVGELMLQSAHEYFKEADMIAMKEAVEKAQEFLMNAVLEIEKYSHRR